MDNYNRHVALVIFIAVVVLALLIWSISRLLRSSRKAVTSGLEVPSEKEGDPLSNEQNYTVAVDESSEYQRYFPCVVEHKSEISQDSAKSTKETMPEDGLHRPGSYSLKDGVSAGHCVGSSGNANTNDISKKVVPESSDLHKSDSSPLHNMSADWIHCADSTSKTVTNDTSNRKDGESLNGGDTLSLNTSSSLRERLRSVSGQQTPKAIATNPNSAGVNTSVKSKSVIVGSEHGSDQSREDALSSASDSSLPEERVVAALDMGSRGSGESSIIPDVDVVDSVSVINQNGYSLHNTSADRVECTDSTGKTVTNDTSDLKGMESSDDGDDLSLSTSGSLSERLHGVSELQTPEAVAMNLGAAGVSTSVKSNNVIVESVHSSDQSREDGFNGASNFTLHEEQAVVALESQGSDGSSVRHDIDIVDSASVVSRDIQESESTSEPCDSFVSDDSENTSEPCDPFASDDDDEPSTTVSFQYHQQRQLFIDEFIICKRRDSESSVIDIGIIDEEMTKLHGTLKEIIEGSGLIFRERKSDYVIPEPQFTDSRFDNGHVKLLQKRHAKQLMEVTDNLSPIMRNVNDVYATISAEECSVISRLLSSYDDILKNTYVKRMIYYYMTFYKLMLDCNGEMSNGSREACVNYSIALLELCEIFSWWNETYIEFFISRIVYAFDVFDHDARDVRQNIIDLVKFRNIVRNEVESEEHIEDVISNNCLTSAIGKLGMSSVIQYKIARGVTPSDLVGVLLYLQRIHNETCYDVSTGILPLEDRTLFMDRFIVKKKPRDVPKKTKVQAFFNKIKSVSWYFRNVSQSISIQKIHESTLLLHRTMKKVVEDAGFDFTQKDHDYILPEPILMGGFGTQVAQDSKTKSLLASHTKLLMEMIESIFPIIKDFLSSDSVRYNKALHFVRKLLSTKLPGSNVGFVSGLIGNVYFKRAVYCFFRDSLLF
ncbi:MAG: hypothetical protein ACTJLM_01535 [Ehrlichia sp.]